MNRKQRRNYIKSMKKIGLTKAEAVAMIEKENSLKPGDKVKIDYEALNKKREHFSPEYIEFIDTHKDDVFTIARDEKYKSFYVFEETAGDDTPWIWSFMDLIKVEDGNDE